MLLQRLSARLVLKSDQLALKRVFSPLTGVFSPLVGLVTSAPMTTSPTASSSALTGPVEDAARDLRPTRSSRRRTSDLNRIASNAADCCVGGIPHRCAPQRDHGRLVGSLQDMMGNNELKLPKLSLDAALDNLDAVRTNILDHRRKQSSNRGSH